MPIYQYFDTKGVRVITDARVDHLEGGGDGHVKEVRANSVEHRSLRDLNLNYKNNLGTLSEIVFINHKLFTIRSKNTRISGNHKRVHIFLLQVVLKDGTRLPASCVVAGVGEIPSIMTYEQK